MGDSPQAEPPSETGFLALWQQLLQGFQPHLPTRRGRKPRLPLAALLAGLVYHLMHVTGTLAEHLARLFEGAINDSSCASRRARLPWDLFAQLLRRTLRPMACPRRHPEAFWRGWRLLALDGTTFSLTNTPQLKATGRKAQSRRGLAAFTHIPTAVLLELGLHNPLAVAIGRHGESEWALGLGLLSHLPKGALVLGDRLYGCAGFVRHLLAACQRVGSHFLVRARAHIKVQRVKRFRDGSWLVRVPVRDPRRPRLIVDWLVVREIQVILQPPGFEATRLRLWTSLLDPQTAPACELVELYARRWDHELFYRNLKHQLRKSELLQSHTLETGAQEIAALMLAAALVAQERVRVANGEVPVLSVSFLKLVDLLRPLWLVLALGHDILEDWQKQALTERFYAQARQCRTPPRRRRSCPRAVRQPVRGWPRLLDNESWTGPIGIRFV